MPGDDCAELSLTQGSISATREWDITITQVVCPGQDNVITSSFVLTCDLRRVRPSPGLRPIPHRNHRDGVQLQLSVKLSSFQPGLQVSFDKQQT